MKSIQRLRWVPVLLALGAVVPAWAQELPRYGLEPGQHLVYEGEEAAVVARGRRLGVQRRTEVQVVGEPAGETWRVIVTQLHTRFSERDGERSPMHKRQDVYVVEVTPAGEISQRNLDTMGVLNRVLPRLPADAAAARSGWTFQAADVVHECGKLERVPAEGDAAPPDGARDWRFEVVPTSFRDQLNGFSSTYTYTLDAERGLITAIESEHRHRQRVTRRGTERLAGVSTIPAEELAALSKDAGIYAEADRAYRRELHHALSSSPPEEARRRLDQGLEHLTEARARVESEFLGGRLEVMIEQHEQSMDGFLSRVNLQSRLLGKPAPGWNLRDLQGNAHALEDYRGKVVVLDFWYRNCGWCIRAMPQVQEVARRFAEKPVAVLGMNTDRDRADAAHVAGKVGLEYPTLLADRGLAFRHLVQSYPTLLVIDQTGTVRAIHVGYTATLADDLTSFIEELVEQGGGE